MKVIAALVIVAAILCYAVGELVIKILNGRLKKPDWRRLWQKLKMRL